MKKHSKRKKIIAVLAVLLIIRLLLPTITKKYLNSVLADLPGYTGAVEDVDIALFRGAYVIKNLHLSVVEAGTEVPFIRISQADISVEWKSLFNGRIVSEIILNDPEVIYVLEDQQDAEGANEEDWTKALTDIVPLNINHLEIHRGKLGLVMLNANPNIDLTMEKIELTADNLSNVEAAERTLPSPLNLSAVTFGGGALTIFGGINLLKEVPDMDLTFELENSNVTALNDFTRYYAGVDFEAGIFEVYGEIAIAESYLTGYVKPFIEDSNLISPEAGFLKTAWEGFVGFFKFVLKNQRTDTVAMKVPFEGDLANIETALWPTVGSLIKNAWIEAFKDDIDDTIEFQDAFQNGENMTKREKRKAERAANKRKDEESINDGK